MSPLPKPWTSLQISKFLTAWDAASLKKRSLMLGEFNQQFMTYEPIDADQVFANAASVLFARFTVGMQLALIRRSPLYQYFDALSVFITSHQGERLLTEFVRMGGIISTFGVLREDELKDKDKKDVFGFLIRMMEGCGGGARAKEFICSDTLYLESVGDCLKRSKNKGVIGAGGVFLETLARSNSMINLEKLAKTVMKFMPCDFNPMVQALGARVLPCIIRQHPVIAETAYVHVLDLLKSEEPEMVVHVGDLSICILETPAGKTLAEALILAALPPKVLVDTEEAVANAKNKMFKRMTEEEQTTTGAEDTEDSERPPVGKVSTLRFEIPVEDEATEEFRPRRKSRKKTNAWNDVSEVKVYKCKQQCGAVQVLRHIIQTKPSEVESLIDYGLVGSALAALGTTPFGDLQVQAAKLCLMIYHSSDRGQKALRQLVPRQFLCLLLTKAEDVLQHLTAAFAALLRRLGRLVQAHWAGWFCSISANVSAESYNDNMATLKKQPSWYQEIRGCQRDLERLVSEDGLMSIIGTMPLLTLGPEFETEVLNRYAAPNDFSSSLKKIQGECDLNLTLGEEIVWYNSQFKAFKKYLKEIKAKECDLETSGSREDSKSSEIGDVSTPNSAMEVEVPSSPESDVLSLVAQKGGKIQEAGAGEEDPLLAICCYRVEKEEEPVQVPDPKSKKLSTKKVKKSSSSPSRQRPYE